MMDIYAFKFTLLLLVKAFKLIPMKQPLNEEFRRMQKLAGIINENTNNTAVYVSKVDWYYIEQPDPAVLNDIYRTYCISSNPRQKNRFLYFLFI